MTTVSAAPSASILHLSGDMDVSSQDDVARQVALATDTSRTSATALVIDMSGVTFLDCAGLRPLLEARNALGDKLWLRQPGRPVSRLLELTRLSTTFHFC